MTRITIFLSLVLISGAPWSAFLLAASPDRVVPGLQWRPAVAPDELGWSTEKLVEARRWCKSLDTEAVMVVHGGVVIDQWGDTALPIRCHSVRKSLLSAMYGTQVEHGTIDLDATLKQLGINDNEPSLTEAERQACVRDLLMARSGIYHPALYETKAMAAARPSRGSHPPNTFWYYNNWDFNATGTIFENLTGRSLFGAFADQIAAPLQMQDFDRHHHTRYVTGDDSVHRAYPFELSTRDLARFGLLFLREGNWNGRQIVPRNWVCESTKSYSDSGASGGYGYMWWVAENGKHFPGVSLPDGSFSARGYRGQYLVVIPQWDLVVCHRVDSSKSGTSVSKSDFGKLMAMIVDAMPEPADVDDAAGERPDPVAHSPAEDVATEDDIEDDRVAAAVPKIERIVKRLMKSSAAPGISIAIATDNRLRYAQGYGSADLEHDVPVTTETRFRTASIAKPLTAAVVLSLAEKDAIDLDADVRSYCPEYPEKEWVVTPRLLLGHLAGVRHYKNRDEARATKHFFDLKSALSTFADDPLIHQPGTKYRYSSFGYNLLGSVAEGAGEASFVELLQQRVLAPAGMTSTVVDDQLAIVPGRSRGYLRATSDFLSGLPDGHNLQPDAIYHAPLHDTSMKIPGGGLLSTPSDLVRFAAAINRGDLLSEDTNQTMWTPGKTDDGDATGYGLGWRVAKQNGRLAVSHTGGQAGTSTVLLLHPESGTSVAVMTNLQGVSLSGTAAAIAKAVEPKPAVDYFQAIQRLREAIRYEVELKSIPAMSVALVDDQNVIWSDGFGFRDAERQLPATAETVYRVGSISKLFTNIAVLQLHQEGKLDLDAPIQDVLPKFDVTNDSGTAITLRQMMSHRSGLVRESPIGNYFDPTEPSLAETVASLNRTAVVYPPDTKTKYSNAALAVVGATLESQLETSHPERVRQSILKPLGMDASGFVVTPAFEDELADAEMWTYDGRRFPAPTFLLGTGPAGNLYSNVTDLSKFLSCLFDDGEADGVTVIDPDSLALMTTPVKDADGKPQGFGLGFHIDELDGHRQIGHGGAVYGFSTQLEALPERKLGFVAASSLDGTNGVLRRLSDFALRLMIASQDGETLPTYRTTVPVPAERARELVGRYRETDGERIATIVELDGEVTLRRGSYRHRLRADSKDGRIVIDDEFSFGTEVQLQDGGDLQLGDTTYNRLDEVPPAAVPDRWKGLIGEYGWDHNVLYILEDAGQLVALIEWFYYYPLEEIGENEFAFPDHGLYHGERLKFERDESGEATRVVAAEVSFERREVGTKDGETFRIEPVRPISELRAEAMDASPPAESGEFRESDLVEITSLDPMIRRDIRYASRNNFTGAVFYKQPRAFLQRPAAEAVARVQQRLHPRGLGLLVHDAYRPWHVTKMFWDATPDSMRDFVANPANGSRHNRGAAVDLTLCELDSGKPIPMVAGYDEFSPRSFPAYPGGTSRQRWYRDQLRREMEAEGFRVYEYEWWHFDYKDWRKYRIGNETFEDLVPE